MISSYSVERYERARRRFYAARLEWYGSLRETEAERLRVEAEYRKASGEVRDLACGIVDDLLSWAGFLAEARATVDAEQEEQP